MPIKKKLANMSDSGEFEILATSILRRADPLYESIIHTGINAEGKAITDPVDGFCRVKGSSPPHYVFFAHTTSKVESLRGKWLREPNQDSTQNPGDVIKADKAADEIRSDIPNAEFTVVLTSNKVLDSDLSIETGIEGDKRGLSVDVWGLHKLSDFLENDPDGQWLAKQHFGVVERRLSEQLLLEIAEENMHSYREELRLQNVGSLIERPELSEIVDTISNFDSGKYLIPIVGNSGFGKTTTCLQAMGVWSDKEKPTLRLTPEEIQDAKSLTQALQSALLSHQPDLDSSAGQDAIQIARNNGPLLITVDDLNRADNPSILFKRISNWVGEVKNKDASDSAALPVAILCPLWPRIWARQERDMDYSRFVDPVELEEFSTDTAADLVQSQAEDVGLEIGQRRARELAKKVGRDPHLIGLLGRLIERDDSLDNLPETSGDVINEYIQDSYDVAVESTSELIVSGDCDLAIEQLSLNMLQEFELEPTWRAVRNWTSSSPDDRQALRILAKQAQLLILFQRQADKILTFRHGRIRDYILANHGINKIERDAETAEFIDDPYYYSILGKGIVYFQPSDDSLSKLCQENPLCLLEALHEIGPGSSRRKDELKTMFQNWLENQGGTNQLPPSMLGEAMSILYEIRGKQAIDIAKSFPDWPRPLLARFKNGDVGAGIRYCGIYSSPESNNSRRDSVMKQVRSQGKRAYAEALSESFETLEKEHLSGALRLAGFLRSPVLTADIETAWEEFGEDDNLLTDFIWAAFRCGALELQSLIDEALNRWSSMPRDKQGTSEFGHIYSILKFSLTKDVTTEQVEYLTNAADKFPDIEHQLLLFLGKMPSPDALEYVVRKTGQRLSESENHSPGVYMSQFTDEWNTSRHRGQALPTEAKERMKEIWSDEENSDEVRYSAFLFWAVGAEKCDLEDLQLASEMKYSEYFANITRLKLGDKSLIRSTSFDSIENSKYLRFFANVWCEETYEIVDEIFGEELPASNTDLHHDLAELLVRLDKDIAEEILDSHWENIGSHREFFQAALYTSTPLTRELARKSYLESDDTSHLLTHVGMLFGFNVQGKSELLSEEHLLSLEPYLSDIDDMTLSEIARKAKEIGMKSWSVKNIQPELSDDARKTAHPTDEDLLEELNEIEKNDDRLGINAWLDRLDRRLEPMDLAFEVIEQWLKRDPTTNRYKIAAKAIRDRGTREDLSIIDEVSLEGDEIQGFYDDAKFGVQVRSLN